MPQRSVFGARTDLAVFLLIPFAVASLAFGLSLQNPALVLMALYLGLDHLHVYIGIGQALKFPAPGLRRKLFLVGFPIAAFAFYVVLHEWIGAWFYTAFASASIFHFSRQQIGWMRLTRSAETTNVDRWLSDVVIYTSTIGFVLFRIAIEPGAKWFVDGDLGYAPWIPAGVVLAVIALVNSIYLFRVVHGFVKSREVRRAQNLVWISTLATWGVAFGVLRSYNLFSVALIIAHHAVPFLFLSYKYVESKASRRSSFVILSVVAFVFAGLEIFLLEAGSESSLRFIEPLIAMASTYHYAIDSFFWSRRFNPEAFAFRNGTRSTPVSSRDRNAA